MFTREDASTIYRKTYGHISVFKINLFTRSEILEESLAGLDQLSDFLCLFLFAFILTIANLDK